LSTPINSELSASSGCFWLSAMPLKLFMLTSWISPNYCIKIQFSLHRKQCISI
jgi:hypothetical protein